MATTETKVLDNIIASRRAMLIGGGAALAALAVATPAKAANPVTTFTDADILNFALNLEYLEGNFYYLAAFGTTIDKPNAASIAAGGPSGGIGITGSVGTPGVVLVKPNPMVPFVSVQVGSYATETAIEEGKHVSFLRSALGSAAVAQPTLDLFTAWDTLASAAGIGPSFDPFASDANFLVGAYVFEDVGVSAYHGAAPFISRTDAGKKILGAAVGIHAVEAYHAGLVRTSINVIDPDGSKGLIGLTQKVSALRTKLAQAAAPAGSTPPAGQFGDDIPLTPGSNMFNVGGNMVPTTTLVDADFAFVRGFSRTTTQVLNIVTGGGAVGSGTAKGVFFPNGLNGLFS